MNDARRVDAAVLFGAALVAGALVPFAPIETLATLAVAGGYVATGRPRARPWVLACAAILVAMGAVAAHRTLAKDAAARAAASAALPVPSRCAGLAHVVASPVEARGTLRWTAHVRKLVCDGAAVPFEGEVTLYGGPPDLARGDELEVVAQLAPLERFWNEATGDPRPSQARRRAVRSGGLVDARFVTRGAGPAAWIDRLRARVRARIRATFAGDTEPMARAIVLGESDLSPEDDAAFRTSGLAHLLAVSGMHLVLVVAGLVRALRAFLVRLGGLAELVPVHRVAAAAGILIAWGYADFAGGGGSTLRASWMMTAALAAEAVGRRAGGARSFGLSLLMMGVFDPLVIFDVSFLLSAAATAGLLALARPIGDGIARAALGAHPRPPFAAIARAAGVTLAATGPCAPILARFAPTLPLGGALANLLAVPLGEACALPLCLCHAVLGFWPSAERGCALAASGALAAVRAIARGFTRVPWLLVPVPPPTRWQLSVAGIALLAIVLRRARGPVLAVCTAAFLLAEVVARHDGAPRGLLRATFFDVGQGDAALVDLPDGSAMVIDGGGLVGSPVDPGERVLAPALRARRRGRVAVAALSHPHPDHFTGLPSGLAGVSLGEIWDTGQGEREGVGGAYAAWLAVSRQRAVAVLRPSSLCGTRIVGGARVEVLAPCPDASPDRGPNDNSLVVRLCFGKRAMLFVGDAEREEEADLLALGSRRLKADVLKVGHHGSRTSTSAAFLAAVAPSVAVISVGARNHFGHPHPATLGTLQAAHVTVYRTDRDGEVVASTDGSGLEVRAAAR